MKVIKAFILILILALIVAPFGIGMWAEGEYNRMITQLSNVTDDEFKVVGTFSKGYLQSTATTEITNLISGQKLKLVHTINQGPIILNFNGWLHPASYIPQGYGLASINTNVVGEVNDEILHLYDQKQAYTINTMIHFNGSGQTHIKAFPLKTNIANGAVDWQGFDLIINNNLHFVKIDGKLTMPSLSIADLSQDPATAKNIAMKNLSIDFTKDTKTLNDTFNLMIGQISATDGNSSVFTLNQYVTNLTDTFNGDMLVSDFKFTFSKLTVMQDEYGPFTMDLKFKNINYSIIKQLNKLNSHSGSMQQANAMQPPAGKQPSAAKKPLAAPMHETPADPSALIIEFLTNRPTLDMALNLKTTKGDVDVVSHLEVGDKTVTQLDLHLIMATITAELKLKISAEIVYAVLSRMAEQQIHDQERMFFLTNKDPNAKNPYTLNADQMQTVVENWVNNLLNDLRTKKLIVEENDNIDTDISLNATVFTVNGTERSHDDIKALRPLLVVPLPAAAPAPATTPPNGSGGTTTAPPNTPNSSPSSGITNTNSTIAVPPATTGPSTTAPAVPAAVAPAATTAPTPTKPQ